MNKPTPNLEQKTRFFAQYPNAAMVERNNTEFFTKTWTLDTSNKVNTHEFVENKMLMLKSVGLLTTEELEEIKEALLKYNALKEDGVMMWLEQYMFHGYLGFQPNDAAVWVTRFLRNKMYATPFLTLQPAGYVTYTVQEMEELNWIKALGKDEWYKYQGENTTN